MRPLPFSATFLVGTLLLATTASAQEPPAADPAATAPDVGPAAAEGSGDAEGDGTGGAYPMRYALRPMTLPPMMLSPQLGFSITNASFGPISATIMNLRLGAEFGVIENLTVEATPLAVSFGDADGYGIGTLGATYRFYESDVVEAGARLRLGLNDGVDLFVNAGVPVRIHGDDLVRVDTGLFFNLAVPNGGDAAPGIATIGTPDGLFSIGPGIPIDASFSIIDNFYAGLNTGFGLGDFTEAGDTIFVPLGFHVGGTVPMDEEPVADISAGFSFPFFANSFGGDAITADIWTLSLNAKGYFQL